MTEVYTQPYFDLQTGKLLIGEAAIEQRLQEEGGQDIVPLASLLTAGTFDVSQFDFKRQDSSTWTDQKDIYNYGKWALAVIKNYDEKLDLTRRHINRLGALGIGLTWHQIYPLTDHEKFGDYKEQIYNEEGYDIPPIQWPAERFQAIAKRLNKSLRRKLNSDDFNRDAEENPGSGAPRWLVSRKIGIGRLNDELGYPDFTTWKDQAHYICWGLAVTDANPGIEITPSILNFLSSEDRGPSEAPFIKYFGSWSSYKLALSKQLYIEEEHVRLRHERYSNSADSSKLPKSIQELSARNFLKAAGMYTLVKYLIPEQNGRLESFAHQSFEHVVMRLTQTYPELDRDYIVSEAHRLEVFEDIMQPAIAKTEHLNINSVVANAIERGDLQQNLKLTGMSQHTINELVATVVAITDPASQVNAYTSLTILAKNIRSSTDKSNRAQPKKEIQTVNEEVHRYAFAFLGSLLSRDASGITLSKIQLEQFLDPAFAEFRQRPHRSTALTGRDIGYAWAYVGGETHVKIAKHNNVTDEAVRAAKHRLIHGMRQFYGTELLQARFREVLNPDQQAMWDRMV